ncbi:MAG: hypothetical protein HC925_05210 [Coleofasciculaceae cyanobacterium SM2_3_26]|nr:hypothetical protein [Coleofasciculaceae cyanobacterium SM2_3_26]
MQTCRQILCFRANWRESADFDDSRVPDWLEVRSDWQGYTISTVPWVADVARIMGTLSADDTLEGWIEHLNSLGLRGIVPVDCEELWEDRRFG